MLRQGEGSVEIREGKAPPSLKIRDQKTPKTRHFACSGSEAASRQERSLAYRLRQAHLPWRWSLDSFPFDRQPGVSKAQIQTLAGLEFLRRADNILFIGKPGTGKTGLAMGLLR